MQEVDYSHVKGKTFHEFKFIKKGLEQIVVHPRRSLKFNPNETLTRTEPINNEVPKPMTNWTYERDPHSHKMIVYPRNYSTSIVKAVGYLYKIDDKVLVFDKYDYNGDVYESVFYKQE